MWRSHAVISSKGLASSPRWFSENKHGPSPLWRCWPYSKDASEFFSVSSCVSFTTWLLHHMTVMTHSRPSCLSLGFFCLFGLSARTVQWPLTGTSPPPLPFSDTLVRSTNRRKPLTPTKKKFSWVSFSQQWSYQCIKSLPAGYRPSHNNQPLLVKPVFFFSSSLRRSCFDLCRCVAI